MRRPLAVLQRLGDPHQSRFHISVDPIARVFRMCPTEWLSTSVKCDWFEFKTCTFEVPSKKSYLPYNRKTLTCVVSYSRLALVTEWDQYEIGYVVLSDCFFNSLHLMRATQILCQMSLAPQSTVTTDSSGKMSFSWRLFIDTSSFSFCLKFNSWKCCNLLSKDDAVFAKFRIHRLEASQTPRRNLKSETFRRSSVLWRHLS